MLFLVQFFLIAHLSSKVGKGPELAHMLSHYAGFWLFIPVQILSQLNKPSSCSIWFGILNSMGHFLWNKCLQWRPFFAHPLTVVIYWPQLPWQHCLSFWFASYAAQIRRCLIRKRVPWMQVRVRVLSRVRRGGMILCLPIPDWTIYFLLIAPFRCFQRHKKHRKMSYRENPDYWACIFSWAQLNNRHHENPDYWACVSHEPSSTIDTTKILITEFAYSRSWALWSNFIWSKQMD